MVLCSQYLQYNSNMFQQHCLLKKITVHWGIEIEYNL